MKKNAEVIELKPIEVKHATIFIEGDGDLVLNQMNARNTRLLTDKQSGVKTVAQNPNVWEDIITAVRWYDDHGMKDTYKECNEEKYHELLKNNKPCIRRFGGPAPLYQAVFQRGAGGSCALQGHLLCIDQAASRLGCIAPQGRP